MTFWYKVNKLQNRIGQLVDTFDEYLELQDMESGEYVIKHYTDCEIIKKKKTLIELMEGEEFP